MDGQDMTAGSLRRLNWGCGGHVLPGWLNSDRKERPGVNLCCDIHQGLPLETDSIDYAASIHALPEVAYDDLVPVLSELRRVLKPGGVLRLVLPDLIKGVRAYERGDRSYFLVPDDAARSLGAKLVTQLIWFGHSRTLFTSEFIEEMLIKAGFARVEHCSYRVTRSPFPEIIDLDNRQPESLYVEAVK
jgi:predicted SAM-dependent methyltransferase